VALGENDRREIGEVQGKGVIRGKDRDQKYRKGGRWEFCPT